MSIDVTDATFPTAVIDRSHQVPVVVDVWAPWCGPCQQLGPIIEQVVAATEGRVELVKVNADENPQISAAFKVQSIPAVFALRDGKVVGDFIGARGEQDVRDFVEALLPSELDDQMTALVAAGDEASLRAALELRSDHEPAIVALGELLAGDGRGDEALVLLERIPETAATRHVAALARSGTLVGDDDVEARLTALLERVKEDDEARQQFVDLLELLGPEDPRTTAWRKALTARLY